MHDSHSESLITNLCISEYGGNKKEAKCIVYTVCCCS